MNARVAPTVRPHPLGGIVVVIQQEMALLSSLNKDNVS